MRLGVISDTHDRLLSIAVALDFFASENVELVVHCGDWKSVETAKYFAEQAEKLRLPVLGVLGNNDVDVAGFIDYAHRAPGNFQLREGVFEFMAEDTACAIYHGHHAPTLRRVREDPKYSFVFLGHTHKPKIERVGDRILVNPGSTAFSIPRSKEWQPTVAIIDTDNFAVTIHALD